MCYCEGAWTCRTSSIVIYNNQGSVGREKNVWVTSVVIHFSFKARGRQGGIRECGKSVGGFREYGIFCLIQFWPSLLPQLYCRAHSENAPPLFGNLPYCLAYDGHLFAAVSETVPFSEVVIVMLNWT